MDNHDMTHKRSVNIAALIIGAAVLALVPMVSAAELGMNYYHESMMGAWGGQYIPRSDSEINSDLDDIKTKTRYIKLYANPLVNGNVDHALRIADKAKAKGMHVVLAMNTEDRELNDGNWWDYRNKVLSACGAANGRVDEFIVGNEIGLHSPWDTWGIRNKVEPLINDCSFNGPKTYEAFFWDRDAWKSYNGRIYLNMYEHYDLFAQNVDELNSWNHKPHIGEWGDNFGSEEDQAQQIRKRWNKIQTAPVERAYVFTYKEPSPSGTFGVLANDGRRKPAWDALPGGSSYTPPAPTSTTSGTSASWSIGQLRDTMTADGGSWEVRDETSGECRTLEYGTNAGTARVLACKKGDAVEMYVKQSPSTSWKLTLGSGNVGSHTGYARFTPSTSGGQTSAPQPSTPTQSGSDIGSLPVSGDGSKVEDTTSGTCRTIRYAVNGGQSKVLACEKGSDVEIYVQQSAPGNWQVTLGSGSVGSHTGYVRFTPTAGGGSSGTSTQAVTSSAPGWSSSPAGNLVKHEDQGSCELAGFDTSAGYVEALACDKGGYWEMYLKSGPNGANIQFNGMSVGKDGGFDRT